MLGRPTMQACTRIRVYRLQRHRLRRIQTGWRRRQDLLLDQHRFIQMPQSSSRYNFQFSDNEIQSVQAALRRLGIYSGQVDGILGPETQRAVEDYQAQNKLPLTGQPDQTLNALLGIF